MNNPPAFQFYPKDFISDANVEAMTLEETGAYIRLLCLCWIEDGIPIETAEKLVDRWLGNGSTKSQPEANLWSKIKHCFYEKGGKYRNKRLDLERQKQIDWGEKSRRGGLKAAENKRLAKAGYTKGQPKAKQRSTKSQPKANSSVFSLQSSIKKDSRESYAPSDSKNRSKPPSIVFNFDIGKFENISEDQKKKWAAAYPIVDIELFIKRMEIWQTANPEKKKSRYERAFANWLRKEQDQGGTKGGTSNNYPRKPGLEDPRAGLNIHPKSQKDLEYQKARADFIKTHGDDKEKLAEFSQQWHGETG